MTLEEIVRWLDQVSSRPATPVHIAQELNQCSTTDANMVGYGRLYQALVRRFHNLRRQQITEEQVRAVRAATDFGSASASAPRAFPKLNRTKIALQLIARVLDPSLVHQGSTLLCGPAAVAVCLARAKPLEYVECCASLADTGRGKIGELLLQPRQDLREYDGKEQTPAADWILCASIRNVPRAEVANATGSSGNDVFQWMKACGFGRVSLMLDFPMRAVASHPPNLLPGTVSTSDKVAMARVMCDLSTQGWHVVLLAFGDIAGVVRTLDSQQQAVLDNSANPVHLQHAETTHWKTYKRELEKLNSDNPSLAALLWKNIWGSSGHALHATYVQRAKLEGNGLMLTCSNWGNIARWVKLPLGAFANKMVGFVAAMD